MNTIDEVFVVDVLSAVCGAMKVAKLPLTNPVQYFQIRFEPGFNTQIIDDLKSLDGSSLDGYKYPLVAAVMPISEKNSSGFLEVTFPRIVIAHLTKSGGNSEKVISKYDSGSVFKDILRPCLREFIKNLAWSKYTSMGDPDMYEYTSRELPSQRPISQGLMDFVDIIEILNLTGTFYSQIKSC